MSIKRHGMVRSLLRLSVLSCMVLVDISQVEAADVTDGVTTHTAPETGAPPYAAEVTTEGLEVFDKASEQSYVVSALSRGDTVRVRELAADGWLAIDPPPTTVFWIERSAIQWSPGRAGQDGHVVDSDGTRADVPSTRAWVSVATAVVRVGNRQARMPGPPRGQITQGTMVRLVDQQPLRIGNGPTKTIWYAIVPPADLACYVRADGTRKIDSAPAPAAEIRASYEVPQEERPPAVRPASNGLPPDIKAEIDSIESMALSIKKSRPPGQWQFEPVRARYQDLLKRPGNNAAVEDAIRARLADLTRFDEASAAARKIDAMLAASHDRDQEVSALERRLAGAARTHARAFNAIGFVQPSARSIDGHKLYALIGKNGSTLAYLDVPPGLNVEPLLAQRVGVRGVPHYNEELGARLITVRDIETVGARR
jgi:hypothetical protein